MSTAKEERPRGLSADERNRRRLAGIDLTRRAEIVKRFDLSDDDRRRMSTLDASDGEVAAYIGFPEIQADAIKTAQAERETARLIAKGSLRAHLPTTAITGSEESSPSQPDMPTDDELPYFGE
ncbi:MAG TPA: hypothetical protein VNG32_03905 [Candidatus Dormibacteraeota bacterium]|nr:hypothetical protein [Candidatus Dormibacteraeota bacterium]